MSPVRDCSRAKLTFNKYDFVINNIIGSGVDRNLSLTG